MSRFAQEYPEDYERVLEQYLDEADTRRREKWAEILFSPPSRTVDALLAAYNARRRARQGSPVSDTNPTPPEA